MRTVTVLCVTMCMELVTVRWTIRDGILILQILIQVTLQIRNHLLTRLTQQIRQTLIRINQQIRTRQILQTRKIQIHTRM